MAVRIIWPFRKQPVIYLWAKMAGKHFTPEELMQNLESPLRLSGCIREAVIYGALYCVLSNLVV